MPLTSTVIFNRTFLAILLIAPLWTVAQTASIKGMAPDYPGAQVLVYTPADHLSEKQVVTASTLADEEGNFSVNLDITEITSVMFYIDHVTGSMLVQPEANYEVFFPPLEQEQVRSFSGTATVELVFTKLPRGDVNAKISDLNYAVDSFLIANVALIGSRGFPPKLSAFQEQMQLRFGKTREPYIADHLRYTLALTEFSSRAYTRLDLFKRHLADASLAPHPVFFDFLRAYFQQYFKRFESNYGTDQVKPALEKSSPGAELLKLMEKDDLLQQDTLREMVAVHALMEAFHSGLPKRGITKALEYLGQNGQTSYIRSAAENAIDVLTSTAVGYDAPELSYKNQFNETVSLKDFRGKYVYLEFMATWCTECARDQSLLPDLRQEYGDVVEIVTVVIDSPREEYQTHVSGNQHFEWDVLYDDSGYKSRNQYNVRAVPTYFLIDPEGKLVLSPAPSPTDGIVENLYPILQKAREGDRLKVGEK